MSESFLNGKVTLHCGDNREVLRSFPDCSIDSIVTDPPYALVSIVKRFGKPGSAPAKGNEAYQRASAGFMGKQWDTGEVAFDPEFWFECLRVLKPGGHLVAFSGTRTYHRMAVAIEDAGFEVRDMLSWLYGSGFPKSHNVSKSVDKSLGVERPKVRIDASRVRNPKATGAGRNGMEGASRPWIESAIERGFHEAVSDEAVSDEAVEWQGWGTALKPACEPICFGRKPLVGTVAQNVLDHGTGAINVDGCRIEFNGTNDAAAAAAAVGFAASRARGTIVQSQSIGKESRDGINRYNPFKLNGRWPANVLHDGSEDVVTAFPVEQDIGSAARFFYTAKADSNDRIGSKHPTVKPVDLMQWLCRLVTPKGGTVLDPFAGTGTTAEAAFREGFNAVLIEREAEYQADIRRRMALVLAGPDERAREIIKARTGGKQADAGPLFGGLDTPPRGAGESTESSRTNNRTDRIETVNE